MENVGFKESLRRDDHTEVIFCHSIKTIRTFLVLNKVFPLQQGIYAILSASAKMLHLHFQDLLLEYLLSHLYFVSYSSIRCMEVHNWNPRLR